MHPKMQAALTTLTNSLAVGGAGQIVSVLARDGEQLTAAERRQLLERSVAGEHVELEVLVVASLEPEKPLPLTEEQRDLANANFSRFSSVGLSRFIRSFRGGLMLRDHNKHEVDAIGGEILKSARVDADTTAEFHQRMRLVTPWAVQGVLRGTIRTWSIGWFPTDNSWEGWVNAVSCSVCGESLLSWDCPHYPGDLVTRDDSGERVLVEAVWDCRRITGVETSAVSFPAVQGTRIDEVREALSAARAIGNTENQHMKKIREILGLSEDATSADIVAAIAELKTSGGDAAKAAAELEAKLSELEARATRAAAELEAERTAHAQTTAALEAQRAERAEEAATRLEADTEALVQHALSSGRILPREDEAGQPVETAMEKNIRTMAKRDGIAAARAWVDGLPVVAPIGLRLEAKRDAEVTNSKLTDGERSVAKQLGLTDEQWLRHNPRQAE